MLFADLFQPLMPFEVFPSEYSIAEFAHLLETATVWEDEGGRVWASPETTDDEEFLCEWVVVRDPELGYVWRHTYPELLARRWFVSCGAALAA